MDGGGGGGVVFFISFATPCHATTLCLATVTFAPGVDLPNTAAGARAVYAVDLDADGDVDVLHASNGDDVVGGRWPVVGARPLGLSPWVFVSRIVTMHAQSESSTLSRPHPHPHPHFPRLVRILFGPRQCVSATLPCSWT